MLWAIKKVLHKCNFQMKAEFLLSYQVTTYVQFQKISMHPNIVDGFFPNAWCKRGIRTVCEPEISNFRSVDGQLLLCIYKNPQIVEDMKR